MDRRRKDKPFPGFKVKALSFDAAAGFGGRSLRCAPQAVKNTSIRQVSTDRLLLLLEISSSFDSYWRSLYKRCGLF